MKTLEKLKTILDSGINAILVLDNDCAYFKDNDIEDNTLFIDMTPEDLLREALDMLDIPWEDC